MVEDWMKNCNHCRFFREGYCTKEIFEIDVENNIDTIIDDGLIEEAVREGFSEKVFNSISKNKKKVFDEELNNAIINWVEEISDQVAIMLRNNFSYEYGVVPKNSREFYCSYWD
jgi:hypothetical protein